MSKFRVGQRVKVNDPGLEQLQEVMRKFGHEPEPNNLGVVDEVWDEEGPINYLIIFDDDQSAPYPEDMIEAVEDVEI